MIDDVKIPGRRAGALDCISVVGTRQHPYVMTQSSHLLDPMPSDPRLTSFVGLASIR